MSGKSFFFVQCYWGLLCVCVCVHVYLNNIVFLVFLHFNLT